MADKSQDERELDRVARERDLNVNQLRDQYICDMSGSKAAEAET